MHGIPGDSNMVVKIRSESAPQESADSDFLTVSTCSDPFDDTITLATIQRYVLKPAAKTASAPMCVKTLVSRRPMSSEHALDLARQYAERKNIPVIYTK
jgi:hypothetical protein